MIDVDRWTGEEALLLQDVMRASVRAFAGHLGISPRTVSQWKQSPDRVCRLVTAQILDTALAQCTPEQQDIFRARLAVLRGTSVPSEPPAAGNPGPCTVLTHRFLPVFIGSQPAALADAGKRAEPGPGALVHRAMYADHPDAQATLHVYACGVAVFHLEESRRFKTLTDLAMWRYRTYLADRQWAKEALTRRLNRHGLEGHAPAPEYVLSAYELFQHPWMETGLDTALQLLATPSVLVDRQNPLCAVPLGIEEARFCEAWKDSEAVAFSGGVSRGVASWSGVAYHPEPAERALSMEDIVALELDAQALWALSAHVLHLVEEGRDPVMPTEFGWRFLRGAHTRLTTSRPTETAQHRVMREAIMATSELPARLQAAQNALREGAR